MSLRDAIFGRFVVNIRNWEEVASMIMGARCNIIILINLLKVHAACLCQSKSAKLDVAIKSIELS